MKKILSIFTLLVAMTTAALAQTFVLPEAGKYYKIEGQNANKPWLTNRIGGSNGGSGNSIVVSDKETEAGIFQFTTEGHLLEVSTNKYIALLNGNGVASLQSTANSNKLIIGGNADHNAENHTKQVADGTMYTIKINNDKYMYNNNTDGIVHEGGGNLLDESYNRYWGFIEQDAAEVLTTLKASAVAHVGEHTAYLGTGIGYYSYVVGGAKTADPEVVKAAINAAATIEAVSAIVGTYAVNLPEFGKAYTMTFVANNDAKSRYNLVANGSSLSVSNTDEGSVFYCIESDYVNYPYVFISPEGKMLAYNALTDTYATTGKRINNFEVGGMVEQTSSNITGDKSVRLGTVYVMTEARNATSTSLGCFVLPSGGGSLGNSTDPFHNGAHTSAIVMTEQDINTLTNAQVAKADEILGRTALKEQVEGLRGKLKKQVGYYYCTINGVKVYDADDILAAINAAYSAAAVAEIEAAVNAKAPVLPEYGKAYKMAFKTKAGVLHHIVANDRTLALSVDAEENNASVFYCMASNDANYPYIFVSAEGGFLTFKALSDAYINKVTDFKVDLMTGVTSNVNSSVESRIGTVYIATNKRPNSDKEDDGCFVYKNQNNTYDGADVPFHNDNYTSAIVMTEVAAESKIVYDIVVDGDDDAQANAYVAYDNGTVVRKAFHNGYLVTDAPITEAQIKAGFVGNVVKSATITVEDNVITLADVVTFPTPVKQDLYNTSNGSLEVPPYRIPGITVDPETGRIITTAARLVCGTDPGYGQVDVVCRISDNNGDTWSEMKDVAVGTGITSPEENYFDTAFGDPAVVADRTSNEVLIIVVAGCTKYQTATRAIPNEIGTIHSLDNGNTWGTPVRVTEDIYSLFDAENGGNPIESAFVGGGKIFQSRIVKVGKYYRLYAAMCARPNGNRVIYSDDFGRTWKALGGPAALPAPGGDEPKCEELPDGRVVLSSRVGGGRIYNIYTYSNTTTAEGEWGTSVKSTFAGSGKTPGGNSTNGEILIVPVVRNSDGKDMYLALQSLPTGSGRSNVGIFYKELTDVEDINTVDNFAAGWNGYFEVTNMTSAYSSMDLQNDNRIGFIYEENYTKHGEVSNPHSVPFPDANNLGTHNYDGYDNIYVAYPLEIITNNAYSIKRDVNRRTYVSDYFNALVADATDEMKEKMTTALNALSAEPTIEEVDKLNLIAAVAQEAEGTWYCFRFEEKRTTGGNVVPVGSWGYIGDNLVATATPTKNGSYFWQKIDAGDGKFHLKSMNGKYLVPASTLTTSTEQPAAAWSIEESATEGRDVIFNGDVPCQIHVYKNGTLTNWGWNYSGTGARKDDDGCKFVFVEAANMSDVLDNLYEFDTDAGKVGYYADATIATYKSAVWDAMLPEQIDAAKAVVTSSTVWNMPVSGKAYTFKNVQKDGTTVRWYKYDGTNIVLTANEAEATPFVCRLLNNGKYVFVCNDGKYMTWRATVTGCTTTGVYDAYHGEGRFLTDITIEKMTAGANINGDLSNTRYVSISANRPDKDPVEMGYVVVKKNGGNPTFDGAGAAYYNDNFSSAFIMEEATYANTPKLNSVGEGELLSANLHNKYMGTFSAPFPTIVPEGVTAYYATECNGYVTLNAIARENAIAANTGVILVGEDAGNAVMVPAAAETVATTEGNLLKHSAGAAKDMTGGEYYQFVNDVQGQGMGFYKFSGGTLPMNEAYLQIDDEKEAIGIRFVVKCAIGEYKIATFYANDAMNIPSGVKAYVATTAPVMDGENGIITMTKITDGIIPAKTGAVLRGEPGDYTFEPATEAGGTEVTGNFLHGYAGTAEYETVELPNDGSTNYVLTVKNEKVAFYRKEDGFKVYNNKAYLNVPGSNVQARALYFNFDNDATGIVETENESEKTEIYDLAGRRVQKVQKGLYIVNGKKVVK